MSETGHESTPATEEDLAAQREEIAATQEQLDAESDADGLAAEAGRGEETGISEG
ncbi:hypothetical protein [Nocardioides perillae]|uniref:Uncharacterized protein n=1 Tax=Nocardioides perillae TaxID=1119534 RepID=A0A7Y9RWA9_9ACTN|nr:hypothetical protein [Nocardioides perillae]NYG55733.1 hypothetical protein [Nocardioides perillae]